MSEIETKNRPDPKLDTQGATSSQLSRIERKLSFLFMLVMAQTVLLAGLVLAYWLPKFLIYVQMAIVIAALLAAGYFFRNQLLSWLSQASRSVFSFIDTHERKSEP